MDRPGKLTMCVPITKPCSLPPSLKLELSVSRYVFLPPREPWEEKALCRPPPGRMFCISQNVPESTRSTTTSCECTRVTFVRAVYVAHCVYDFIALSSEWTNEGRKERKKEEIFFLRMERFEDMDHPVCARSFRGGGRHNSTSRYFTAGQPPIAGVRPHALRAVPRGCERYVSYK